MCLLISLLICHKSSRMHCIRIEGVKLKYILVVQLAGNFASYTIIEAYDSLWFHLGMDSDWIPVEPNTDNSTYHILTRFGYEYRYYQIRTQSKCLEFGFAFGYLLDFDDNTPSIHKRM
jgi:hypothetical protein